MTEFSPAAQAVLDAVEDDCIHPDDKHRIAAVALRAAADQVVPDEIAERKIHPWQQERLAQRLITRDRIYTIATELEAQ